MMQRKRLVLASASPSRRKLLENVGLEIEVTPSSIDEIALRIDLVGDQDGDMNADQAARLATQLAISKAEDVATKYPGLPTIGADQILVCDGKRHDKAPTMADARAKLMELQGKQHQLITSVCLQIDNETIWSHCQSATLAMRPLNPDDIDAYLDAVGDTVLGSVGCYHLEGHGAWLFERVEGDFFCILGLPLLPVLETLRRLGIVD